MVRGMRSLPELVRGRQGRCVAFAGAAALAAACVIQGSAGRGFFAIEVVDAATARGVPLVELRTVHELSWVTDSAGLVAIDEPGLMGREVFFHLASHGYEYPKDGFGSRGFRVRLEPAGSHRVELTRINVAERLYRVTGEGIYRDSVLLGRPVPTRRPLLAGGVLGQDSVQNAIYQGRLLWFWGDTNRASYPLGNFATSGAFSLLPGRGGLHPARGVDLTYWVGSDGFSRQMCPLAGPGPVWIDGLLVLEHDGQERLLCHYARMKNLGVRHEHGLALWSDAEERFARLAAFPDDALHPSDHPLRVRDAEGEWFVFPGPYPTKRVRARWADVLDPARYEGFTCLRPGARWNGKDSPLAHAPAGGLEFAWRADTAAITPARWADLAAAGRVRPGEGWMNLRDVETGASIHGHRGTVFWNVHRDRWVMIAGQAWGRSMLGEIWFAEADTPLGPWTWARRIVTHDHYSFYNVKQHPYFDERKHLYFEGTYTSTFSSAKRKTPRYDYNQIMYRLDLDDPRLVLPVAVYKVEVDGKSEWWAGHDIVRAGLEASAVEVPFHALPPDRAVAGSIPVACDGGRLVAGTTGRPRFRVLPVRDGSGGPGAVRLLEWRHADGRYEYLPSGSRPGAGWTRADRPLGRVWPSPNRRPPLWWEVKAAR